MGEWSKGFRRFILYGSLAVITFGAGYWVGTRINSEPVPVIEEQQGIDLELPMEVEKRIITAKDVKTKLFEMSELSTYAGQYTVTYAKDETRYMLDDIPVPGTTNSIKITCDGIVKVGYEISDIVVKVDDDKIYIALPEPKINDNYVIWDTVRCEEDNSIFNPIEFSQYQELIDEIEDMGLNQAIDEGVYQSAEENIKNIMNHFLAVFEEYQIEYM